MLLSLLTLLAVSVTASDPYYSPDFVCLGENATSIRFKNRNDTLVPDLWQVRVMMGGYGSQYALNYAAYMFMREMLGINVTFYPKYSFAEYWNMAFRVDDAQWAMYPNNYWQWLKDDELDVEFEFWNIQEVRGDAYSYYAEGTVASGFVGLFGEISWWMPKYFVDEHPTSIIPYVLKTNDTIRQLLIDGSSTGGSMDWTAAYGEGGSVRVTYNTSHDIPNGSRPICWASSDGYTQTFIAWGLANTIEGGLNIDVVSTHPSGEAALTALVADLYAHRAPFIANIYVPDDSFAYVDNATGEYQNFEKVAFPRNRNQIMDDPCIAARTCQYPVDPVSKAANIRIQERFPEVYQFFSGFRMTSGQLADIQQEYAKVHALNDSDDEHQKWLRASCNWLKDENTSSPVWNNPLWLVDIDRWDCLPGCGLQIGDTDEYFGGTCNYEEHNEDLDEGTCECDFEELYGTKCDYSCPGLLGPFVNDTSDGYYFEWCGGHGECDTVNFLCTCDRGYGGKGCTTKYDTYHYPVGLAGTIITFSALLAIASFGCIVWLRMNAHYKTVKALSIDMTTIFSTGLLMIACSNIALVSPLNDASCIAWQWLFGLGGILSIMSPLLKAYRVSRVFHGGKMLRAVKITDKMLMHMLIKAAAAEVLLCIAYSITHQLFGGTTKYYNDDELRTEHQCNDDSITGYISIASYAYFFIMLCSLTYYSYGTRRALSVFKESTCAYASSFLSMFCTLMTLAFYAATNDPTFRFTVQAVAIIIVVAAVLGLFYGTRIYRFFAEPEARNVTDDRTPTYTSSSTTGPAQTSVLAAKPGPQV